MNEVLFYFFDCFCCLDCGKVAKAIQERVKIMDDNDQKCDNSTINSNMISIVLQGEEGRKSRVKFLMAKV